MADSFKLIYTDLKIKEKRTLALSLGVYIPTVVPPMADALDERTVLRGALYRFCRKHPDPNQDYLDELLVFQKQLMSELLTPLENISHRELFDIYMEESHYSERQQKKFRDVYNSIVGVPSRRTHGSFGKVEMFRCWEGETYKHARCINAPPDEWKVLMGPIIHAVEKRVCQLPWFAKYIPVSQRASHIHELFKTSSPPFYVTDHTSFESSMSPGVLEFIECPLYDYMLQNNDEMKEYMTGFIKGTHVCRFSGFKMSIDGVRMSGHSNTSLGNGWVNLMLILFAAHKSKLHRDEVKCIVEGDDGIVSASQPIDFQVIRDLGFQLKLEPHETIYTTSFCGLMLSRSIAAFSNPRYVLASFGWTHSGLRHNPRLRIGLLRAKALSLFYCNPRCPILTTFARRVIQLTAGCDPVFGTDFWSHRMNDEIVKGKHTTFIEYNKGITYEDRVDFEQLYQISPTTQIIIEKRLEKINMGPISEDIFEGIFDECFRYHQFAARFTGTLRELGLTRA